jgi:hypothetical protein
MKHLRDYLAESERVYHYRIKFVGEPDSTFITDLLKKLEQFDVVKSTEPKTSPIQSKVKDFPAFPNERVTSFDVEFRYPAIEPQVKQLAQLLNFDPNRIIMLTASYEDSIEQELERIEKLNKNLLTDTDFPPDDAAQKELKKDYGVGPYDHAVLKNAYRSDFHVAGGKTPKAVTTNDYPEGKKSPMSKINRPPKPATGAQPRG